MALATFNLNTPNIPDEADILTQVRQIRSYITNLNNQLRYDLSNIDEDNLTGGELPENAISRGFRQKVLDLQGNMSVFEQTATHILARVENAEGDISTVTQTASGLTSSVAAINGDISTINQTVGGISSTVSSHTGQISAIDQKADNISLAVSQEKVWRAATENALNTALSAAGITKAAGLLWYDTTNNVVKRWTGTAWANTFVNTSQIVIDDDSIDIGTTGTLNMQAGGAINIKNLGGTDNVINMDNTGLTLSSTGQLKLQSTDSIIIGGSPFSVGGRNLIRNSGFEQDSPLFWYPNSGTTSRSIGTQNTQYEGRRLYVVGTAGGSNNGVLYSLSDLTAPLIVGKEYVFSFWCYAERQWQVWCSARTSGTGATIIVDQGGWQYVEYKFTANSTTGHLYIISVYNPTQPQGIYLDNMQLEMGTVATDWSPSPQDTVDALDALDGRLGDVETRVQVFYQTSKPTYTAVGDLWYDTDSNPLEVWKCTNVSTQAHSAFTDPVLTRALSAQTTANSKITTFVGSTTPSANTAGDLWMDTGNKNIWKRATAAGTGGWVQYLTAAGYLITTGVTIDGTDLTVKATGNLNLAADGNLNVQSGGNLNVLNGGDIEIANGGDINVASGGKINVSATDLMISGTTVETYASDKINFSVSSIQVGGTNLVRDSGNISGTLPNTWGDFDATSFSLYTDDPWGYKYIYIDRETAGNYVLYSRYYNLGSFAVGDEYTISYYTSNGWTFPQVQICNVSDFSQYALRFGQVTQKRMENGIYYHEATAKVTQAQSSGMSLVFTLTGRNIFITRIKLEKGNKATAWSPSPEEVEAKISMTPSMISLAVDNLQIGGANLLEGTSSAFTSVSLGTLNVSIYPSNPLSSFGGLLPGETITLRAWLRASADGNIRLQVRFWDASSTEISGTRVYGNTIAAGSEGYSTITATIPQGTAILNLYLNNANSIAGTTTQEYKWLKLERGTKATDWTSANNDPATGVKTSKVTIDGTGIAMTTGGKFTVNADSADSYLAMGKAALSSTTDGVYLSKEGLSVGNYTSDSAGGMLLHKAGGIYGQWLYFMNSTQDEDVHFNLISRRADNKSARIGMWLRHAVDQDTKEDGILYLIDNTGASHAYIIMRWNNLNQKHIILDGISYRVGSIVNNAIFQFRNIAAGTAAASGGLDGEVYIRYT